MVEARSRRLSSAGVGPLSPRRRGWNKFGQLGLGGSEDASSPARVGGAMAGAKGRLLASGWKHSLAVDEAGACYAWGRGVNGAPRSTLHCTAQC